VSGSTGQTGFKHRRRRDKWNIMSVVVPLQAGPQHSKTGQAREPCSMTVQVSEYVTDTVQNNI